MAPDTLIELVVKFASDLAKMGTHHNKVLFAPVGTKGLGVCRNNPGHR